MIKRKGRQFEIFVQIVIGVQKFHSAGHCPGNLHFDNILVLRNKCVQLSEFGLRLALSPNFRPDRQPLPITAPESVTGESTMASDLWALGFVLYQLCTLFPPSVRPDFQPQKWAKYSPLMKDLTE
jgi:serine/threonine protein kinase